MSRTRAMREIEGIPMPGQFPLRFPRLLDAWTLIVIGMLTSTAPAWANEAGGAAPTGLCLSGR